MTITVAIPLHASIPWMDNVEANVRALPPTVERIVLSDRTMVDDAATRLSDRLADDRRVEVVAEPRGLPWYEHCQLLVDEASTPLMMLMPHDDVFESSWIPELDGALRQHPHAILAVGRLAWVAPDGTYPDPARRAAAFPDLVTDRAAVRLAARSNIGIGFRGLFRRDVVAAAGIRLEGPERFPGKGYRGVDQLWLLAMAMHAPLLGVPTTTTYKRLHPASAMAQPAPAPGWRRHAAINAVIARHGPGGLRTRRLQAAALREAMTFRGERRRH